MKYSSLPRISGMSRRRWETRTGRGAGIAAQAVFLFCMIFLPYLWGGRQILAAGVAGIAMLLCLILWGSSIVFTGAFRPQPCRGTLVFLLFLLLGALQLSPWFSALAMSEALSRYWELARGTGLVHQPSILAVLPEAHREGLMMFGSAALFSFLAAQLFASSRGRLLVFASGIAMAAALCALAALVQHFGGHDWLFWVYKGQEQSLSGPYFNKNHFAMLQEMGLFTSLGLVLALWSAPRGSTVRVLAKNYRTFLMMIFAFCTVVCITALLFSLSRAGILCSAAGMAGLLLYLLFFRTGRTVPLPLFLLIVSLLLVSFYGLDFVMSRLELALSGEDSSGLSRWEMWRTMLDVMALSPWWGTGIGSVRSLAPLFDLSYMPGFVTYDAHNDYLELAVAFGIPCAVLVLAFLFFFLFRYVRGGMGKSARASSLHPLAVSALLGILVVAGHEAFDYGLKQAANLQIFVALCTLLGGLVRHIGSPEGERKRPAWQLARIFHVVPFLAAGIAFPLWGLYENCLTAGGELARL
ncbi:MAG: O-antigen ligase family protein, partial [Mailhella sp.]